MLAGRKMPYKQLETQMPKYPILANEIAKRNITKGQLAQAAGIGYRAFYNKWYGLAPFTWPEVCKIREAFFGDMTSDDLFTMAR